MGTKKLNNHTPTIKTNQDGFNPSTPMSGQDYPITILQTSMVRLVSQKVGKITNEILGVKWLVLFCSSWSDFWLPT